MDKILLNDNWLLTSESLHYGVEMAPKVSAKEVGWLSTSLPCDVHMPLIENNIIKEPLEGDNFLKCNWIEDKSWWFKKEFNLPSEFLKRELIELVLESLDSEADIFLNSVHLGHQKSSFYPFSKNVKEYLWPGRNLLVIRVTSGLEYVSQKDLSTIADAVCTEVEKDRDKTGTRGDKRRAFVRKPQFVYGWDWGPRVATCGIMKGAYIMASDKYAIKNVHSVTKSIDNTAEVSFEAEIENFHSYSTAEALLKLEIFHRETKIVVIEREELLTSGINYINFEVSIDEAKLWWPNGMGAQELYTARVSLIDPKGIVSGKTIHFGIRQIRLLQPKINENEREFIFEINGVKTFCRGANWIPADSIYARITDEKYDSLLKDAREANFNMLRVWGGGLYERDIFYEKCDEYGIMLWQDFMFACAKYPDNLDWFKEEVAKEMDYQTKRLRNHPSIVLWCGNNENHFGFNVWWNESEGKDFFGGAYCYNYLAPEIVRKNCPEIPYWNSSPYGGIEPNSSSCGDKHHWEECMLNEDMEKRLTPEEYDKVTAKFISEYGHIGPSSKASIIRYHGGQPVERGSEIWNYHNNTFEKDTVDAGITKHYTDADKLDLEGYLTYAGLFQGLMYGYSLEAIRFKEGCSGSLFWMYSDCWGEVGWTIVDYYLKRKISYYFVKRAFAPRKLIIRKEKGRIKVMGANDSDKEVTVPLEYGYMSFDGQKVMSKVKTITLKPFSRAIVLDFEKPKEDYKKGFCFVRPKAEASDLLPAVLRTSPFKELQLAKANVTISDLIAEGDSASFTVTSSTYAHAVHFEFEDEVLLSDEYFDLLPGERRKIVVSNLKYKIDDIKVKYIINNR